MLQCAIVSDTVASYMTSIECSKKNIGIVTTSLELHMKSAWFDHTGFDENN